MEAGGFDYSRANLKSVRVIRQENGQAKHFTLNLKKVVVGEDDGRGGQRLVREYAAGKITTRVFRRLLHRALSAALDIQKGLVPLADDVRRQHGVDFRMRMGLNTGLVVVGAIESSDSAGLSTAEMFSRKRSSRTP